MTEVRRKGDKNIQSEKCGLRNRDVENIFDYDNIYIYYYESDGKL